MAERKKKNELKKIQASIKGKRLRWRAGKTNVSKLRPEKRKKMLGLLPGKEELKRISRLEKIKKKGSVHSPRVGNPQELDWRNVKGVNWTTPIRNQGGCGSCVAFGTIGALESLLKIRTYDDPNHVIDLSEAHLLFCGGGSCRGWNFSPALDYLKNNGVPDEACFPYQPRDMPCSDACPDWQRRIDYSKIKGWSRTRNVSEMKERISTNGPQVGGMAVYTDFYSYRTGIYEHAWGDLEGYHAIAIVGYSDKDNCWICKNSWGTGWGEAGWFRIAYGQCMMDAFGMYNMTVEKIRNYVAKIRIVDPDVVDRVLVRKRNTKNDAVVEEWRLGNFDSTPDIDLEGGKFYLSLFPYFENVDPLPVWYKAYNNGDGKLIAKCVLSEGGKEFRNLGVIDKGKTLIIPACLNLEYRLLCMGV